jgi:hypothetical protein
LNKPKQGGDRTKNEYAITIMLLAVLVVCSAPASAWPASCDCDVATESCPKACGTNGTINGAVYVGGGDYIGGGIPWDENIETEYFDVPDGMIKWSRLYYHVWGGNSGGNGWVNVTFENATGGTTNHSFYCENESTITDCTQSESEGLYLGGSGTHWLYWNVTEYTTSGSNSATIHTNENHPPDTWDGRIMWIVLVTVVENNTLSSINYTVNQGRTHIDGANHTTVFYGGVNASANHTLYALALASNDGMKIHFNDQLLEDINAPPYDSIRKYTVNDTTDLEAVDNEMIWEEYGGGSHPCLAVFYEQSGVEEREPDLKADSMAITHLNNPCYCQTPTEFVVCHTYDVDVNVRNVGDANTSGAFNVSLYDDGNRVDTERVCNMEPDGETWVRLQWHPTTAGTHTLRAMADNDSEVNESLETNNNDTLNVLVLLNDTSAPDLYPEVYPRPGWRSNRTEIVVRAYNNGTTDTGNFNVNAAMTNASGQIWTNSSVGTSVCAKAYREIVYTTDQDLINCSDYTVTVVLDTTNTTAESNELNNSTSKVFHAVDVTLKVTHHYGNTSDYSGQLTGSASNVMAMIDVAKVIPNCTTPYDLLNSEADTITGPAADVPYIYGINNSASRGTSTWYLNQSGKETETCPDGPIYWYCIINGIPMPNMPDRMDEYTFSKPGEVMRMELMKYVNTGSGTEYFRPRPIMDFPEPFKHGYEQNVWATTIVEPSNGNYATEAAAIQTRLIGEGVANVNTKTNATVTSTEKQNNNLILLGTPSENSIIAEINANHTEVGMSAYFDTSDPDAIRLYDDRLYPQCAQCANKGDTMYHDVVMACDNPFDNDVWHDNNDTWTDASKSVWIASGVTTCYAEYAADLLAGGQFSEFWYVSRKCGDVNGDCKVNSGDYMKLYNNVAFGPPDPSITTSEWAADVNCDCNVNSGDYMKLYNNVAFGPPDPSLECCGV